MNKTEKQIRLECIEEIEEWINQELPQIGCGPGADIIEAVYRHTKTKLTEMKSNL